MAMVICPEPPAIPLGPTSEENQKDAREYLVDAVYRARQSGCAKPEGAKKGIVGSRSRQWAPTSAETYDSNKFWRKVLQRASVGCKPDAYLYSGIYSGARLQQRCKTKGHCRGLVENALKGHRTVPDVERALQWVCCLCGFTALVLSEMAVHLDAHLAYETVPVGQLKAVIKPRGVFITTSGLHQES